MAQNFYSSTKVTEHLYLATIINGIVYFRYQCKPKILNLVWLIMILHTRILSSASVSFAVLPMGDKFLYMVSLKVTTSLE